jgi:hypothetical protein
MGVILPTLPQALTGQPYGLRKINVKWLIIMLITSLKLAASYYHIAFSGENLFSRF